MTIRYEVEKNIAGNRTPAVHFVAYRSTNLAIPAHK
jgi:hypothetical protein